MIFAHEIYIFNTIHFAFVSLLRKFAVSKPIERQTSFFTYFTASHYLHCESSFYLLNTFNWFQFSFDVILFKKNLIWLEIIFIENKLWKISYFSFWKWIKIREKKFAFRWDDLKDTEEYWLKKALRLPQFVHSIHIKLENLHTKSLIFSIHRHIQQFSIICTHSKIWFVHVYHHLYNVFKSFPM